MLNLDDQTAIDYSGEISYLPRDCFGELTVKLLGYVESGPPNSEENQSDKEYDVATVEVLSYEPQKLPETTIRSHVKPGEQYVLWFQTGGNGVTQKNRAYKAAELRQFVVAACGLTGEAANGKVVNAKRAEMLKADYSDGTDTLRLKRVPSNPIPVDTKDPSGPKKPGEFYSNTVYSAT